MNSYSSNWNTPYKSWLLQLGNFKNVIWTSDTLQERYAIKFCFKLGKLPQKRMECFRLLLDHHAWIEHQFLSGIRDSRKAGSLWGMMRGMGGVRKSIHQSWLAKWLGLELLCWGFKGVQKEIPSEEASTLQIGSVAFHQDNAPVLKSIVVTDYLTKMSIKTVPYRSYSPDLTPCDSRLFPKLWGCRYETIKETKETLTRSHKRTSMGRSRSCWNGTTSALQPEKITSNGTRVSCVYYQ